MTKAKVFDMKRLVYIFLSLLLLGSLVVAGYQPVTGSFAATGRVLNLYGIDPLTLDPAVSGEMTSHQYVVQIFSGLVRLDDNLQPIPDIARSWKVSDDGKTYTFYLRQDVKFQDGRQVKATDVKYSWERACDPATRSQTAATYLGDIVGVKEVLAGQAKEISGVKVVDDFTIEVTVDAPKSYFLYKLNYPTAFIVDRANVERGSEWWRTPNGTGPFKMVQWDLNTLLVLERNELYYGEPAKLDQVAFHLWSGVPMNLYETGQIDVTDASTIYIDWITDPAGPFYGQMLAAPELSFSFIGFDHSRPPFDDVNVRRAFSMAIDRDKIISLMFRDMVQKADGILPPGMPGYNPGLVGQGFDPAKARELIKASRYGDVSRLPPITLTTAGWGGLISSSLEAIIQEWWQNLGVEVRVRQLEPERFLYNLKQEKDELFDMGWIADYAHPQDFLDVLFRSRSELNYGGYSSPEVDALVEKANTEMDTNRSFMLYQEAEKKLVDDAACIPLWFGKDYTLVKPYVKGYMPNPLGFVMLSRVSVEPH